MELTGLSRRHNMGVSKTNAEYYDLRKTYIEGALQMALTPIRSFDGIEYTRKPLTGEEFVKISDLTGATMFLEVTGMTRAEILKDVAKCILLDDMELGGLVPESLVKDINLKREIARLFN